jgi:glycosyltransferase involved in cell wall biosynthesis
MDQGQKPTISICIPAYDPELTNLKYLKELFTSLDSQTVKPDEIIITSNNEINYIKNLISQFPKLAFNYAIKSAPSASSNFNNCAKIAKSDYLKFICQDDFFISNNSLQDIVNEIRQSSPVWMVQGSKHFDQATKQFTRTIKPKFKSNLSKGINRIGSPSVVIVRRNNFLDYDENIKFAYDCDWYLRMFHNYGKPHVYQKNNIGIRLHDAQSTKSEAQFLNKDITIMRSNHKRCKGKLSQNCNYARNDIEK